MIQSIRDAIEFFMIQRHSWQELARVVVGLFLPLIVMILWVLVHKQGRKGPKGQSIPWRDEK